MSRGFTKEEDREEAPIIPPRAALPTNETNYVTPAGMQQLLDEREGLVRARENNDEATETERRKAKNLIDGKLNLLNARINTARVIDPEDQPKDEVRFGARVTFVSSSDKAPKTIQIVGVDEASVKEGKIGFVAPVVRALTGTKKGDTAVFSMEGKERKLKVLEIKYF